MVKLPDQANVFNAETCTQLVDIASKCISEDIRLKRELGHEFKANRPENFVFIEIRSTWYFIKCIEAVQKTFGLRQRLLYRGHSDSNFELTPGLMRERLYRKMPTADQVVRAELSLMGNFQRQGRPFIRMMPSDRDEHWEWVALAQHHRLPTRFLDWSYRAAVGLYFAVSSAERTSSSGHSCVWCIASPPEVTSSHRKYPSDVETVYLFNPPHISPRIIAQQACFTVHPSHYIDRYYKWIDGPRIIFLVSDAYREEVEGGLRALGIHHASMFPELDGISNFIADSFDPTAA